MVTPAFELQSSQECRYKIAREIKTLHTVTQIDIHVRAGRPARLS